jgi:hypothetical protein
LLGLNQPVNDMALTIQYETMRAFCPADARLFAVMAALLRDRRISIEVRMPGTCGKLTGGKAQKKL